MALDTDFELDVLSQCLREAQFLAQAIPVLRRHHFSNKHWAWIWQTVHRIYSENREVPTGSVWGAHIDRTYPEAADRGKVVDALLQIRRHKPQAPKSGLDEIRRFVQFAALRAGAEGLFDGLAEGDIEGAERALAKAMAETRSAASLSEPSDWAQDAEARLQAYESPENELRIPTPMDSLNNALHGGLPMQHIGLLVAFTNVGKSTFAVDLGFTALMHGPDGMIVIHICTEEPRRELEVRYDARFTGIPRDRLLSGKLSDDDKALFRAKFSRRGAKLKDRLILQDIQPGGAVGQVRALVERIRVQFPDAPILVVADSPDHLVSGQRIEAMRHELSAIYMHFRSMAMDPTLAPFAAWVTTQAKQEYEKRAPTSRAVGEAFAKSQIASVVLGLKEADRRPKGEEDGDGREKSLIEAVLSKNRVGRIKKLTILMKADTGTCEFREVPKTAYEDGEAIEE